MNVTIVNHTVDALETLLYTKNTRLRGREGLDEIRAWPLEKKLEELEYMRWTIQSSWEFVDYTFEITGISRVATHQLVRTRTASYAQEAQRAVDVRDADVVGPWERPEFEDAVVNAKACYEVMIDDGVPRQDARYVLPEGTQTGIMIKANLRTLHDMGLLRLCFRAQGEYQKIFGAMREEVVKIHPWAAGFLMVHCAWYGRCAFPHYDDCPVSQQLPELRSRTLGNIAQRLWKKSEHEANPVAEDGKTMAVSTDYEGSA